MRDAFSNALVDLARRDPRLLLLTGDHGYALFDAFRKAFPERYINAGIAEQNMVGMAAGLARIGFRPFVYGLSAFVPIRVLEQIKLDIAHDDLPVVLLGDGAGFVYSHLGTSHQSTEDIACARAIAGLTVLSPADAFEVTACMEYAHRLESSVYLRMGKSDRGSVHSAPLDPLVPGKLLPVREGTPGKPVLIATGSMIGTALELELTGSAVWSVPMIKPLDAEMLCEVVAEASAVIVLEEHSIYGGVGSAVCEVLSERMPKRVLRVGVNDRYSEHCGSYNYLLREHGLDTEAVRLRIANFMEPR